jgi:tRNA U54 and U55 pseudouridine synthase Pus10
LVKIYIYIVYSFSSKGAPQSTWSWESKFKQKTEGSLTEDIKRKNLGKPEGWKLKEKMMGKEDSSRVQRL